MHNPHVRPFSAKAERRSRMTLAPKLPRSCLVSRIEPQIPLIGSRAGAVIVGEAYLFAPSFHWKCLTSFTVTPSPAPAART